MVMKTFLKKILYKIGYQLIKIPKFTGNEDLFRVLNFEVSQEKKVFLINGLKFLENFKKNKNATFYNSGNDFIIEIENAKFSVNSWEELLILNEVFIDGDYNIQMKEDFTLFDIGMNVGITSLYFAKEKFCKKVFAFEPFLPTRRLAEKNFLINSYSNKIEVNNYGLGFPERILEIDYSEEIKGSIGVNSTLKQSNVKYQKEILEIRDVAHVFKEKAKLAIGKIVVKMDCEGAEYEILERLKETGDIYIPSFFMIEWHDKGSDALKKIFEEDDFKILSFKDDSKGVGMLYVYNKRTL